MSGRLPTPEQSAAIAAAGKDVLVEAGAGTGKTGVMVDRYCRLVLDQGVAPDSVLAFTFTDKAAAELRERIRTAIEARADAGSERARELLDALGGAWVMTIHGFCNRLLASHPVAVGIDPRFRVLDSAEADRAAHEAFDEALTDFLGDGDEERERTVAAYEIAGLRGTVIAVHAELRSRGLAEPALPDAPVADVAGAIRRAADAARAALTGLKPGNGHVELLERAVEILDDAGSRPPDLDEMTTLQTTRGGQALAGYREAIDAAVAAVAETGEGGVAYRHLGELLGLFSARFAAAKERRAGLDFEDLQILATRLLERSELGAGYRARFTHLLVDEFQDTNRSQLRLIEALRGPATEVMMVGDELQSIYGFRHADLDVFREQRRRIEDDEGSLAIGLSGNFRSRPELIGAVNEIGGNLLGAEYRPLRVGVRPEVPAPAGDGAAVEILLTGESGWDEPEIDLRPSTDARTPPNQLAEARFLAARLRALADADVPRGEMVVLLRAFTHLDAYEDSLERAGLRPYVVGGRGYWSQQQVSDVCALLATIANPLDDRSLFGSLASPACGVSPDTLWLLRAAAGHRRPVWPAIEHLTGGREAKLFDPEMLDRIDAADRELLDRFAENLALLRSRAPALPLAELIDTAVIRTGYDLAVLMRSSGEARFANVRKLMRLAAEFEAAEGRDLRGLLDFLAARAVADADAAAATAIEGHDGVRIMTVHSAKGLEFGVVAIPQLARRLLRTWPPAFTLGREEEGPRVGLRLRRLGAPGIELFSYRDLWEEAKAREAEEELRLFHVAATRARERLILSGIVRPEPVSEISPGTPVIERIASALGLDRDEDSAVAVPPPLAREGLDAAFEGSEIAVRVSLASPERAAELARVSVGEKAAPDSGTGPAPLLGPVPAGPPKWPLSYSAIAAFEGHPPLEPLDEPGPATSAEAGAAWGTAVHSLIEWSGANGWRQPPVDVAARFGAAAGIAPGEASGLLEPVRGWLGSPLFAERVAGAPARSEVPILLEVAGTVLRGSIDLLVERPDGPPLIVDFKTDRLGGHAPEELYGRYGIQRDIYALAVSEARRATEVEVAYVFLERPDAPVAETLRAEAIAAGRDRLEAAIGAVQAGS
ncbi:MAG TPA: UvrD-helicase domain-containing protein [Solirubrobacterales bacterium]